MAHLNKSTEIVSEKNLLADPVYKDNKTLSYKRSDLVHWEDPEGSGGEGGGRGDRDGEYMYIHGWFMSMYDKNQYNIVK